MRTQKFFSRYRTPRVETPNLVAAQVDSYSLLLKEGVKEIFKEFTPIKDYSGKKFDLEFVKIELGEPKFDEHYAKAQKMSLDIPLRAIVRLKNKAQGTEKEQEIFLADFPLMTDHGTFVINGVERVIVPQLARSYGVFFTAEEVKGKRHFGAKVIPARGAWIEIEADADGQLQVRIDRKRKFPATSLLRVLGAHTDADLKKLFTSELGRAWMETALEKDPAKSVDDAYVEIHKRLRDGDLATAANARDYINSIFSEERYDLSRVGRYRFNQRFDLSLDEKDLARKTLSLADVVIVLDHVLKLENDPEAVEDNIDHLGSRRVRYVGEMLQQRLRVGLTHMKRNIQDRMSTIDTDATMPQQFVNPRPLQARIKEFFTTNQLSQFMQQENALTELEHLRTLSALGPGGLTRERAGFEVRDVHPSHYGRLCPIHTPEGPNIGLILRLSTFARLNEFGMIETPYVKVAQGKVTGEVVYLNAAEEEKQCIAHGATKVEDGGRITEDMVEVRLNGSPARVARNQVNYIDVDPAQPFSIATSMIPFLEHDDANRALMGSNMQKQATPCIVPEAPLVATGMEGRAARDTGRLIIAKEAGTVVQADGKRIIVRNEKGKEIEYPLVNFVRTNGFTALHQRPAVSVGTKVKQGDLLGDTSTSDDGQLALGQNALVAFMCWSGANYEDAIIISERLVKNSKFASIHIEEFVCNVRDTKLGPEETTHDIPNVSETKLRNLDEDGIIRTGSEVRPGDILVGKITPKGETQLTPEERLLRSIFGDKARDVKDSSLRMENGKRGRIIGVKVFSREAGHSLESGIIKRIHIEIAQLRTVSVGDKLAGRHGNKGVISRILPEGICHTWKMVAQLTSS
jgi:DNA-directed RNA polymerase subunit beta